VREDAAPEETEITEDTDLTQRHRDEMKRLAVLRREQ